MSEMMIMTDDGEMIPLSGVKYKEVDKKEDKTENAKQRSKVEKRRSSHCGFSQNHEID